MRYRALLLTTTMLGALAASVPAIAQEGIEVVTVTARQRSEALQVVPVAVTAISEARLEKYFVRDLQSLSRAAPNVTVEAVGAINRTAAVLYSRGIGYSGIDQAIDPSVGVSVDGLFYPRNLGMLQQMFDAASVEIARGPQGTLYGKNTTGGVFKIATKAPVQGVYSLDAMLKYGNFGRTDYGVIVNVPLTDTLAFRLAAQSQYSDGYVKNTYLNPTTGTPPTSRDAWLSGDDVKTLRGSLQWEPNDNFTGRVTLTYIRDRSDSAGGQNGSYPAGALGPGFGTTTGQTGDFLALAGQPGFGFPGGPTQAYVVQRSAPNDDRGDNLYGTINLTYHAPWFDIESTTGFQNTHQFTFSDFDDSALPFFETFTQKKHRYFQQELRLLSNDEDSRLSWVAGLYYNWYWYYTQQDFTAIVASIPTAAQTVEGSSQNEWTVAPYFQADYEIIPKLTLTGGVRFSTETKALTRFFQVLRTVYQAPANTTRGERTWTAFTYHAAAKYEITDDAMVYASFSTGFKSGAFNSRAPNGTAVGLAVDGLINPPANPEKAKSYEVGARTQWFDDRLRANVTAFWTDYTDLQVQFFLPLAGAPQVLANGANQRSRGVELELEAVPIENLTLSASVGYLDARYTSFVANLGNNVFKPTVCNNVTVDRSAAGPCYLIPYRSPQWTMQLQATYDYRLPDDRGMLTPAVTFGLESTHATDLNNSSQGIQPTYTQVDGSLTYTDPTERYRLAVWGKNLTNVRRTLSAVPSSNFFTQLYFNEPRTFGLQLNVKMSSENR